MNKGADDVIVHPLCERFLNYLRTVKGRTAQTVEAYALEFRLLHAYLLLRLPGKTVLTVSPEDLENYLYYRKVNKREEYRSPGKEELSANTLRRTQSTLNSFYTWAVKQKHLQASPMTGLEPGKRRKTVPVIFTDDQLRRLVVAILTPRSEDASGYHAWKRTWRRDFAMINLMAYLGLRRSEVASLSWRQVDLQGLTIVVHGKGKKQRKLPLSPRPCHALLDLREYGITSETAVFVDCRSDDPNKRKRLQPWSVTNAVKKYVDQAELPQDLSAHKLRHAFATALLDRGADIRFIADLLGHEDIKSTQIYTHPSSERLAQLIEKVTYGLDAVDISAETGQSISDDRGRSHSALPPEERK